VRSAPDPHRSRRRRPAIALAVCVAVTASSVSAQEPPPPGFSDGHWQGTVRWQATLTGGDLVAEGLANGSFEVQWSAGAPTGTLVGTGSGSSSLDSGGATLSFDMSA